MTKNAVWRISDKGQDSLSIGHIRASALSFNRKAQKRGGRIAALPQQPTAFPWMTVFLSLLPRSRLSRLSHSRPLTWAPATAEPTSAFLGWPPISRQTGKSHTRVSPEQLSDRASQADYTFGCLRSSDSQRSPRRLGHRAPGVGFSPTDQMEGWERLGQGQPGQRVHPVSIALALSDFAPSPSV